MKCERGFVLAEMIIALTIIVILTFTLLPVLTHEMKQVREKRMKANDMKVAYIATQLKVKEGRMSDRIALNEISYRWEWKEEHVICLEREEENVCYDF
ncbi:hypothetical protein [Savagea faecisuis]|uniref:Type II secretion system protein n=1 Tax=Savagea faecisuis TaxID=1274803 RepID=A0ABW3GYU9_9BACL